MGSLHSSPRRNVSNQGSPNTSSQVIPGTVHTAGSYEVDVSNSSEANLHQKLDMCNKNPGHENFIPVQEFDLHHLPEGHRDIDLYDLIKVVADMVVKVEGHQKSPARPKVWPNSNKEYPVYNRMWNGSGEIDVVKYKDGCGYDVSGSGSSIFGKRYESGSRTCPCGSCQTSDQPKSEWWEILVYTAAHVVFDEVEAEHATCKLFYDDRDSSVVRLDRFSVHYQNVDTDRCVMKCATCDVELGDKLFKLTVKRNDLWRRVRRKYPPGDSVTFIVSHPHGCTKQVSLGYMLESYKVGNYNLNYDLTSLRYTTPTCPGSSGAWVHCIGFAGGHVHTGALQKTINYSSAALVLKPG